MISLELNVVFCADMFRDDDDVARRSDMVASSQYRRGLWNEHIAAEDTLQKLMLCSDVISSSLARSSCRTQRVNVVATSFQKPVES